MPRPPWNLKPLGQVIQVTCQLNQDPTVHGNLCKQGCGPYGPEVRSTCSNCHGSTVCGAATCDARSHFRIGCSTPAPTFAAMANNRDAAFPDPWTERRMKDWLLEGHNMLGASLGFPLNLPLRWWRGPSAGFQSGFIRIRIATRVRRSERRRPRPTSGSGRADARVTYTTTFWHVSTPTPPGRMTRSRRTLSTTAMYEEIEVEEPPPGWVDPERSDTGQLNASQCCP